MTLIPGELGEQITHKAGVLDLNEMQFLLYLRDEVLVEINPQHGQMDAFWREVSAWSRGRSPKTLRRKVGYLRDFPAEKLIHWFEQGFSFDHIENACLLIDNPEAPNARSIGQVFDWCVNNGDELPESNPPRFAPASVDCMVAKFLSNGARLDGRQIFEGWVERLCNLHKLLNWPIEKQERLAAKTEQFADEVRKEFFDA